MISDANGDIFGDPDRRLARRYSESQGAQGHADAEELLSAAHVHAELLRVHAETARAEAEAARAEAESLRAEAAALRRTARDEAAAAGFRAEALIAEVHAIAEELRSATEGQAEAAAEAERARTEAASVHRLLQGEIGARLADTEEIRAQVRTLWAETDKLATQLRLLSARDGAAAAPDRLGAAAGGGRNGSGPPHPPEDGENAEADSGAAGSVVVESGRHANGRLEELHRAMKAELEQQMAEMYPETGGASARLALVPEVDARKGRGPAVPQLDVSKLLSDIWERADRESTTGLPDRGLPGGPATPRGDESPNGAGHTASTDLPVGGRPERPKASEPLIGSGGWRAGTAPAPPGPPDQGPVDSEAMSSPPDPGRQGRRFRRRG